MCIKTLKLCKHTNMFFFSFFVFFLFFPPSLSFFSDREMGNTESIPLALTVKTSWHISVALYGRRKRSWRSSSKLGRTKWICCYIMPAPNLPRTLRIKKNLKVRETDMFQKVFPVEKFCPEQSHNLGSSFAFGELVLANSNWVREVLKEQLKEGSAFMGEASESFLA